MAKLQLYINKSQRGYSNMVNINPEEDVNRKIHDYSDALSTLDYDHSRENTFYLLSYFTEGVAVTAIRTIAGERSSDHIAATVLFPNGICVTDGDISAAVRGALAALDPEGIPHEAVSSLRSLFAKDFATDADAPARLPSSGHIYAFAYYGGSDSPALSDYVAARFYLPDYSKYAGILLVDETTKAKGRDHNNNLTCKPLPATTTMNPPRRTREGFMPHIYRNPFTAPLIVPADTDIEIQWKRAGFDTVTQTVRLRPGENPTVTSPDTSQAHKLISPASFYITEQGTQRAISSFLIKVNGTEIEAPTPFTYGELRNAKVEISSPGYFAFTGELDLASSTQALVQMKQLHRTYCFDLPLHAPDPVEAIRIYLKTKKPIEKCPIEGYSVAGGEILEGSGVSNSLIYVGGRSRRMLTWAAITAVAVFLLGFFTGWLAFDVDEGARKEAIEATESTTAAETTTETAQQTTGPEAAAGAPAEAAPGSTEAPANQATATAGDIAGAVSYLDSHKSWKKEEMEANATLAGLFDDLNNYNFERINSYWAPLLAQSRNFKSVAAAVKGSATKRDPRTGRHAPTYNPADDTAINWLSYTYWVDP